MKKCDFCKYSSPKGKCYFDLQPYREEACKEAIKIMCKTLREDNNDR